MLDLQVSKVASLPASHFAGQSTSKRGMGFMQRLRKELGERNAVGITLFAHVWERVGECANFRVTRLRR